MMSCGMCRIWLATVAMFATMASVAAVDAATAPQPGFWNVVTTTERDGAVRSVVTKSSCLTTEDLQEPEMGIAPSPADIHGKCTRAAFARRGDGLSWDIECVGNAVLSAKSTVAFDTAQHFSGVTQVRLGPKSGPGRVFTAVKTFEARRAGECKP